jgi:hypothetical protein
MTMYKTTTTHLVSAKLRIDKIFPDGLPVNAFIDKGRCAIGATTNEIKNLRRCTFIVVPNISILIGKQADHPEIDIVYGDITLIEVEQMLRISKKGHKIMTTPEGMKKIMDAAVKVGRLDEIKTEWFLLLDEAHTFISERYRKDILRPFVYFWDFKMKTLLSATPYHFSDSRFETLHLHEIRFTDKLGKIALINCKSVVATLNALLLRAAHFPGNIHIFYNSINEIVKAIERAKLDDCHIYCADDKEQSNMKKLGDLAKFFVSQPKTGKYAKVNFYTCKYFEGWDLHDDNSTVVFVTDVNKAHTKVGVSSKGKQAIGRLREEAFEVIHFTNHKNLNYMKPLKEFKAEYLKDAQMLIKHNNEYVADCKINNIPVTKDERLMKFANINKDTQIATLNLMKLDQQINEAANNEVYNHIDYIKTDWESGYFDVELEQSDIVLETKTVTKRKSASKQLEEDYFLLKQYKLSKQSEGFVLKMFSPVEEIKKSNPTAYKAFEYIDEATMINLKYNVKAVEKELILKQNGLAEFKLLKLLEQTFKVGNSYSNDFVKNKLQEFYQLLDIRSDNGKIRVATATQIRDFGRFEADDCKVPGINGTSAHGKYIIRAQFNLRMVA